MDYINMICVMTFCYAFRIFSLPTAAHHHLLFAATVALLSFSKCVGNKGLHVRKKIECADVGVRNVISKKE